MLRKGKEFKEHYEYYSADLLKWFKKFNRVPLKDLKEDLSLYKLRVFKISLIGNDNK